MNAAQLASCRRDGFLLLPDFLSSDDCDAIQARTAALVEGFDPGLRRGSVVVLHGLLPHAGSANRSSRPRHAYTLHLIDGCASYDRDNWLQRTDLPLRGFT